MIAIAISYTIKNYKKRKKQNKLLLHKIIVNYPIKSITIFFSFICQYNSDKFDILQRLYRFNFCILKILKIFQQYFNKR